MRRPYPFDDNRPHPTFLSSFPDPLDRYYSDFLPQFNRKRQRRQAAAIVVESLWNNSGGNETSSSPKPSPSTRKSTAQPRPILSIPPKGIGPIADPNVNDVLCGRGGRINSHAGNVHFRDVIHAKKKEYLAPTTKKLEKAHIAAGIVNDIRTMNPPGRFLKEEKSDGMWYDIGDAKAIKKTGQALREDAPDIRPAIDINDTADAPSPGDEEKMKRRSSGDTLAKSNRRPKNVSPRNTQGQRGNTLNEPQQILIPILPQQQQQGFNNAHQQIPSQDYKSQMSMPPPFASQGNNNDNTHSSQHASQHQQYMQNPQGFQVPNQHGNRFSSQLYSGVQTSTSKFGLTSRKAMEALAPPEELAFGMTFHDPSNPRHFSDDNTISTISGLSEPLSSVKSGVSQVRSSLGMSDLMNSGRGSAIGGASDLMNMSLKSNISLTDSLRLRNSMRASFSSQNRPYDPLMPPAGSYKGGSAKGYDAMSLVALNESIKSGFGGSLTRSNSFPDNMSTVGNSRFEGVDNMNEGYDPRYMMDGRRGSSAMSIGSIMDVASNASSGQWFQAALGTLPLPDDSSFRSSAMMSADLDALDLASTF